MRVRRVNPVEHGRFDLNRADGKRPHYKDSEPNITAHRCRKCHGWLAETCPNAAFESHSLSSNLCIPVMLTNPIGVTIELRINWGGPLTAIEPRLCDNSQKTHAAGSSLAIWMY